MRILKIVLLLCVCSIGSKTWAQSILSGIVIENDSRKPIYGASITIVGTKTGVVFTDVNGRFTLQNANNKKIVISYLGFQKLYAKAVNNGVYALKTDVQSVGEVVVTAQESKGLATASTIQKHAMEHLQPSSFSDLLELLPGGRSKDPNLSTPNNIRLREANARMNSNYATSSLGTSFVIDGAPMSTNANMQYLKGSWELLATDRDNVNEGVDMRSISTDDIEKVEVVRGIPSVEYGDLTTGLVKIERKRGGNDINARLKADMGSKLFYVSKGFEWKNNTTLNLSADLLNSKTDPRNLLETYKRLSFSARFGKKGKLNNYATDWKLNADYGGSFDGVKRDEELNNGKEDSYQSAYHRFALNSSYAISTRENLWFKALNAVLSASYEQSEMKRVKFIELQRTTPAVFATENSEGYAYLLPYRYMANQRSDGKPVNVFAKLNAKLTIPVKKINNSLLLGVDWNMDKNYGKGQLFNPRLPLYPLVSLRNRKLSSIPANHTLAFYAEENLRFKVLKNEIELLAGLRVSHMANVDKSYKVGRTFYPDLRFNAGWTLPSFYIMGKKANLRLSVGVGEHTKNPTISQLYPDVSYLDIIQLNYNSDKEEYKRIHMRTYAIDNVNKDLEPARNLKWEASIDFSVHGNRLSATIFREDLTSGFRSMTYYAPYSYKVYNVVGLKEEQVRAGLRLDELNYENVTELFGRSYTGNGSRTLKRGLEYTFSTRRFKGINTRLTINGAWFITTYQNSQSVMERAKTVVNERQVGYAALYKDNDKVKHEMANTNFTFDTDVPRLKLGFSISAQCLWFTSSQKQPLSLVPDAYMKPDGQLVNWKEGDEKNALLRWLVRDYTPSYFKKDVTPFSANVNFKVTKKLLKDKVNVAMFCNKLWDYTPDYKDEDIIIRRHVNPYFGLEINVKL